MNRKAAFIMMIMLLLIGIFTSAFNIQLVKPEPNTWPVNTWINMNPPTAPPARGDVSMVYDSENEVVVLFGGGGFWTQYCQYFGDTWIYNVETNTWTNMNPAVAPCPRTFQGMTYDSDNKVVVLYGGVGNDHPWVGALHDTWIYDVSTNTWTNMNPANAPQLDAGCGMAYDSEHKKIVLHGFHPWPSEVQETWTYDVSTNTWTNMEPSSFPIAPRPCNLEYDNANNVHVLLRGIDVWTYSLDTNTWTKKEPPTQPPSRWHGTDALAYDSENCLMILFGGYQEHQWLNDTWGYNVKKNIWINLNPSTSPPGRGAHGIVYDSKNEVVVLFGGDAGWYEPEKLLNDTWVYRYHPEYYAPRFHGYASGYCYVFDVLLGESVMPKWVGGGRVRVRGFAIVRKGPFYWASTEMDPNTRIWIRRTSMKVSWNNEKLMVHMWPSDKASGSFNDTTDTFMIANISYFGYYKGESLQFIRGTAHMIIGKIGEPGSEVLAAIVMLYIGTDHFRTFVWVGEEIEGWPPGCMARRINHKVTVWPIEWHPTIH